MDGARSRFDISDEVNLAILASEIVDKAMTQPTVFSPVPTMLPSDVHPRRQLQVLEGSSYEWRMYEEVANSGLPEQAPGADKLRNELTKQLSTGAQQGSALESSLQQLVDREGGLRQLQQERNAYIKRAAAMVLIGCNLSFEAGVTGT